MGQRFADHHRSGRYLCVWIAILTSGCAEYAELDAAQQEGSCIDASAAHLPIDSVVNVLSLADLGAWPESTIRELDAHGDWQGPRDQTPVIAARTERGAAFLQIDPEWGEVSGRAYGFSSSDEPCPFDQCDDRRPIIDAGGIAAAREPWLLSAIDGVGRMVILPPGRPAQTWPLPHDWGAPVAASILVRNGKYSRGVVYGDGWVFGHDGDWNVDSRNGQRSGGSAFHADFTYAPWDSGFAMNIATWTGAEDNASVRFIGDGKEQVIPWSRKDESFLADVVPSEVQGTWLGAGGSREQRDQRFVVLGNSQVFLSDYKSLGQGSGFHTELCVDGGPDSTAMADAVAIAPDGGEVYVANGERIGVFDRRGHELGQLVVAELAQAAGIETVGDPEATAMAALPTLGGTRRLMVALVADGPRLLEVQMSF